MVRDREVFRSNTKKLQQEQVKLINTHTGFHVLPKYHHKVKAGKILEFKLK